MYLLFIIIIIGNNKALPKASLQHGFQCLLQGCHLFPVFSFFCFLYPKLLIYYMCLARPALPPLRLSPGLPRRREPAATPSITDGTKKI